MNQLIPDLSYLHNDNSCTDFGDGYSLLRCRPEAMPHSLTTKMSMLTQRRLCRPNSYMESVYDWMNINEATLVLEQEVIGARCDLTEIWSECKIEVKKPILSQYYHFNSYKISHTH